MRISTALMAELSLNAMNRQQAELSQTQLKISTGQALLSPSDNPYASSRALGLEESIATFEQYQVNAGYARDRLVTEEGVLEGVGNVLQRVRELALNATSDSQTAESRRFIAAEVRQLYDQMLSLANSTDANNEYLFAGYQGKTKPFVPNANTGRVEYKGDGGQRFLKVGPSTNIAVSDSGETVFYNIRNGNGTFVTEADQNNTGTGIIDPGSVLGSYVPEDYTIKFIATTIPPNQAGDPVEYYVLDRNGDVVVPSAYAGSPEAVLTADIAANVTSGIPYEENSLIQGLDSNGAQVSISGEPAAGDVFYVNRSRYQEVFQTIKNLYTILETPINDDAERALFHNAMNRVITDLDQALGNVLDARARVGARINVTDKQFEINESFNLQMKQTLSSVRDLDFAQAVTDLNLQLAGLQAAQSAYTKIQGLSLFNYL